MFERLDEIDWASLSHAYGSAADVPELLRALASDDAETRRHALWELYGNIFHQGSRYEATRYAAPFVLELVASPETPARHELVELLTALAIGYDSNWLPEGFPLGEYRSAVEETTGNDALVLAWEVGAYDAVREGVPMFRGLLADPDSELVKSAAFALAWFAEEREDSVVAVERRLAEDVPPAAAATMSIALGLLDADPELVVPGLDDDATIVRTAAAIALARLRPHEMPPKVVDVLADAVAEALEDESVPFFDGDLGGYAALSLALLPAETAERGLDRLLAGLQLVAFPRASTVGGAAFRLAFPEPIDATTFDSLTPVQQRVVRAVAEARTAWMPKESSYDANFASTVRSFGFPGDPDEFRAFAGLPPFGGRKRGVRRMLG
jgi:hypothetical protein